MPEEPLDRDELENEPDDDGPPSTPFDHPLFLPVLLWGFTIWFAYDTFMDTDVGKEYRLFNEYGFGLSLFAAIYNTVDMIRRVPFGLAVLLSTYALWLGYEGWIGELWFEFPPGSPVQDELRVQFNRAAAGVLAAAAILNLLWNLRPGRRKDSAH